MKKVFLFVAIALLSVGCASKKDKQQEAYKGDVSVTVPCSGKDYQSNSKTFRSLGMGFSTDMQIARSKALQNARAELATQINATIKRVVDNYASSYQMGEEEEAKSKFQDLSRTVDNRELGGTIVICDETTRTPEGKFRCYIVVELGGPEVAEKVANAVKADDKLRIDYEYEKFKQTFDEEMNKLK